MAILRRITATNSKLHTALNSIGLQLLLLPLLLALFIVVVSSKTHHYTTPTEQYQKRSIIGVHSI
jgi:hypothetical protein